MVALLLLGTTSLTPGVTRARKRIMSIVEDQLEITSFTSKWRSWMLRYLKVSVALYVQSLTIHRLAGVVTEEGPLSRI